MSTPIKWEAAWVDRGSALSTELNALAADARTAAGAETDNSVNLDQWGKLELTLAALSGAPASGAYVEIYMITAPNGGGVYEDGSDSVDPGAHKLLDRIPVRASALAQRLTSRIFRLEPAKTKFLLAWKPGNAQALAATANKLVLYSSNDEVQ